MDADEPDLLSSFRTTVLGLWVILVASGALWIHYHPRPSVPDAPKPTSASCQSAEDRMRLPGFLARRDLPVNTWISVDDLDWASGTAAARRDSVEWRYSKCPVKAGERFFPDETRTAPLVAPATGLLAHRVPLASDPRLSETADAGSMIDVWQGGSAMVRGLAVLAIYCPPGTRPPSADCEALVAASPSDALRLEKTDLSTAKVTALAAP